MENTKIEIPEEFRVIAVRANRGNKGPMAFGEGAEYFWPDHGSAYPQNEKAGLFGILLNQDFYFLKLIAAYVPYPRYLIIEVDTRKIFNTNRLMGRYEIEFSECNVIFSGQLPEFLETLKEYATQQQFKEISDVLGLSLMEILESRESPEKAKEYVLRIKNRADIEQAKESLHKGRYLLRKLQQDRTNSIQHQNQPNQFDMEFVNTETPKLKIMAITGFFRDGSVWETLKAETIPKIIANKKDGAIIRAWVVGCCTGEEAYSMAIIFKEAIEQIKPRVNVSLKIYATDLNSKSIDVAKKGIYTGYVARSTVSPERIKRFFKKVGFGDQYQVVPEIRKMVVFQHQDVIDNLYFERDNRPFNDMDIISCRYVLMYIEPGFIKRLLDLFYHIVVPGGFFVGCSSYISTQCSVFIHIHSLIFRKTNRAEIEQTKDALQIGDELLKKIQQDRINQY